MIKYKDVRVIAESGGDVYHLNSLISGLVLREVDGLGISEVARVAQRSPSQIGDSDLGNVRLPRYITLSWALQGKDQPELWDIRARLNTIFRPRIGDPVVVKFILPRGDVYAADVNLEGELTYRSAERRDARSQLAAIVLKASDPRLYKPTLHTKTFTPTLSTDGWSIGATGGGGLTGWSIGATDGDGSTGWAIGRSASLNEEDTIAYADGSKFADEEHPIIYVYGPITEPVIENKTTGERLSFTGSGGLALAAGRWMKIDLRFGHKTVVDQDGNSLEHYLSDDSDLAGWHLSYNTELLSDGSTRSDGENEISITGVNATGDTRIVLNWYDRYIGI